MDEAKWGERFLKPAKKPAPVNRSSNERRVITTTVASESAETFAAKAAAAEAKAAEALAAAELAKAEASALRGELEAVRRQAEDRLATIAAHEASLAEAASEQTAAESRHHAVMTSVTALTDQLKSLSARYDALAASVKQEPKPIRLAPSEWKINAKRGADGKIDLNSVTMKRISKE